MVAMKLQTKTNKMKTSEKFQIKSTRNTVLSQFVKENLDEIVERKLNILNPEHGFIYLHEDGSFREGRNNEYGQSMICGFGGIRKNEWSAIRELEQLIEMDGDGCPELKPYLKS